MSRRNNNNNTEWGNREMNNRGNNARFTDFEFYTLNPNVSIDDRFELPANVQTPVANLTIDRVQAGDLVWLNGVIGLDNDDNNPREVVIRIFRNTSVFIPGQEIYRAVIDLDGAGDGDQQVIPLAHVDQITTNDEDVTYTVTVQPDGDDVFLNGPVTFTAVRIRR